MKQTRADEGGRPWNLQLEAVTGCSMKYGSGSGGLCHFCGIQAIRNGPGNYQYMSLELVQRVATQIAEWCPKIRLEFALRGEPLIHPKIAEIISILRTTVPKLSIMLTTNGDTLRGHMQERTMKLFDAGLNLLLLDTYWPQERRDALRQEAYELQDIRVEDFFEDLIPRHESPYSNHSKSRRYIVLMDDLAMRDGEHSSRQVKTHAGSNPTKEIGAEFPLRRNCGRPLRELIIHADGNVPLCCDDWKQEYIVGNAMDLSLEEIWNHPKMEAARARLMVKDRSFGPCAQCDAPSAPRSGLLPLYDPPTEEQITLTEKTFVAKKPVWSKE